jgi:hypothetical protein
VVTRLLKLVHPAGIRCHPTREDALAALREPAGAASQRREADGRSHREGGVDPRSATSEESANVRIVEMGDGGWWRVSRPGCAKASAVLATQAEAVARAREIVAKSGGGELSIRDDDGALLEIHAVPPRATPGSRRKLCRNPRRDFSA